MKRKKILPTIVFTFFIIIGVAVVGAVSAKIPDSYDDGMVTIQNNTFSVAIADTNQKRSSGLSHRSAISDKQGMFFVFDSQGDYAFWMQDMEFAIDIIWIDDEYRITHIEHQVSPESFPESFRSPAPSQYVLEVRSGIAGGLGWKVGDLVNVR